MRNGEGRREGERKKKRDARRISGRSGEASIWIVDEIVISRVLVGAVIDLQHPSKYMHSL